MKKRPKKYPNPRPRPQPYFCKARADGKECGKPAEYQSARGVTCQQHAGAGAIRLLIPS